MTWRSRLTRPARGDLVAGVSVALVLVPQALAYAELAGLPPVHGLYAAAVAPLAGALVGSSPYLQTGPTALTSLLTFGALAPLAATGSSTFIGYAAVLALLVGAVRLLLGLLRWGGLAYFMSVPVVTGFTVAAALLIICSQLPGLVGVEATAINPVAAAGAALARPDAFNVAALAIGLGTIAVVSAGRLVSRLVPWVLVATTAALVLTNLHLVTVPEVGPIPAGLPPLALDLPWDAVPRLIVPACVIALVGFAEPASIARHYAGADRRPWDPDREFTGQGLANLAAGVFGGYPTGGSFARSALNRAAGARTRFSGAVTGLAVLACLPAARVLSGLPVAVLAGIVIASAAPLANPAGFRDYWRYSRPQFLVAVPTFAVTLAAAPHVERGLLVGVALALAVHLWRETRIHLHVRQGAGSSTLLVVPAGVLYFASAPAFGARLADLLDHHPGTTRVIVDLHRLGRLDLTGLLALRDFAEYARASGVAVEVRGVPAHARVRARRVFGGPIRDADPGSGVDTDPGSGAGGTGGGRDHGERDGDGPAPER